MSATNRGAIRRESDFYRTPEWVVDSLIQTLGAPYFSGAYVLEPCAGDGVIVEKIRSCSHSAQITAIEIRPEEKQNLIEAGADQVIIDNFLEFSGRNPNPDIIITNPPYSIAQEIIEHCFEIAPNAEIIMLLRLAFLESKKRKPFWDKHPVTQLYVLSERPSFTSKGTDATAYAWFVWSKYRELKIQVI